MGGQTPVTFLIEPLLYVSSSLVALGDEVELTLVDWPATDQVMDHVASDAQGVDRVVQSAVPIAGIPQEIISGEGQIGPDNEHTFLVRVGATVPAGIHELRVRTYTADQMMSDVPRGASDAKNIKIWDRFCPLDPARTPGSVAGDRAALVALYNATDGANWTDNTNWLTDTPIFQWYGVSADAAGRVCALNLHGNGLSGEIPLELGGLTNLTGLDLSGNRLSGEIPLELGGLTNLTGLDLYANQLNGEIPAELGRLKSLEALFLSHNRLSGEIPKELGNLTNLWDMHLSNNQLTGCVPASLRSVANNDFAELGLSFCDMFGPGSGVSDRAALVALYNATDGANWTDNTNWLTDAPLYLDSNQLTGEIPAELDNLTSLGALFLSHNRLSGEIPSELGNLTNLRTLELYGNQLTGQIPSELGDLTNLRRLYLLYNHLSGEMPAELGGLSNLQVLYLNNNQLRGEIPAEFGRLTNLTYVTLSANRLSGRIPGEFGGLFNLTFLDLRSNQLKGEIPAGLSLLSNLRWLSLSYNQLSGEIPSSLGSLSSLKRLHLRDNRLSGEIPAELGNLSNLQSLWLRGNQLSGQIPAELGGLTNLEGLRLSSNRLTGCVPASLRDVASHDFAELGLPFCDMLDGPPVVVIRFVSAAGAPVRLGSPVSLEATFTEPVTGFSLEDISVANGVASNFSGSGAVYTFDVTPYAIGDVTVDIAAGAAQGADGKGNIAARLSFGIPYDDDGNGAIGKSEVIAAINDYLFEDGSIAKSHLIDLINLYLFSNTP